ncbi:hypothetical protein G7046_g764 [Stylonectria norvegica]|nr:hypothetical protein G7046_g764 [Stylonectria norvegica]
MLPTAPFGESPPPLPGEDNDQNTAQRISDLIHKNPLTPRVAILQKKDGDRQRANALHQMDVQARKATSSPNSCETQAVDENHDEGPADLNKDVFGSDDDASSGTSGIEVEQPHSAGGGRDSDDDGSIRISFEEVDKEEDIGFAPRAHGRGFVPYTGSLDMDDDQTSEYDPDGSLELAKSFNDKNRMTSEKQSFESQRLFADFEQLTVQKHELAKKRIQFSLAQMDQRELADLEHMISQTRKSQEESDKPVHDPTRSSEISSLNNTNTRHTKDKQSAPSASLPTGVTNDTINPPKVRRKPAKDAREVVARIHEADDLRTARSQERKRKRETQSNAASRKRRNVPATKDVRRHMPNVFDSLNDAKANVQDSSIPAIAPIQATTQAEQFAKLKANIPAGCDTRHTSTQAKDLADAVKVFGNKKVEAVDGKWHLKGMKKDCLLENHQITTSGWMVKRELARSEPFGGMLAHAMGLGKTVMSLACIVGNPPSEEDVKQYCQATLVIVPSKSIADQWKGEIQKHCESPVSALVTIYSKSHNHSAEQYALNCVVIATYRELQNQSPSKGEMKRLKDKWEHDQCAFEDEMSTKMGCLFQNNWYRVILDEAHTIKNRDAQSEFYTLDYHFNTNIMKVTRVCWQLRAKSYWALSGTPLANSEYEFYPYLKFLRCQFTRDIKDYKHKYVVGEEASNNFQALVSLIMQRRTLDNDFLGQKLVDLPDSNTQTLRIPLSREEHIIYQTVNQHYEKMLDDRKREKNEDEEALQQPKEEGKLQQSRCTHLRQALSHPFNLEKMLQGSISRSDIETMGESLRSVEKPIPIREVLRQGSTGSDDLSKYSKGFERMAEFGMGVFGGQFNMDFLLELVSNEREVKDLTCRICKKATPPVKPLQSSNCEHIYCEVCLMRTVRLGRRHKKRPEIMEKKLHCPFAGCIAQLDTGDSRVTLRCIKADADGDSDFIEPGRDSNNVPLVRGEDDNSFFIAATYQNDDVSLPPSSKLTAAMAVILTWQDEAPEDKIIVFTQFIMTGKILGHMLNLAMVPFVYLYGSGSEKNKKKTISDFKEDPEKKILLASLRCGAQSLNLTVANRVILIDPWWNTTMEQQAFGRVQRMGQTKNSHLVRIMAEGSVDERIEEIQDEKSETISCALQDDGHEPVHLSDEQLGKLFAPAKEEEKSKKKQRRTRPRAKNFK